MLSLMSQKQHSHSPSFPENLPDLVIRVDGLGAHDQHQHVVLGPAPPRVQDQALVPPPLRHLRRVKIRRK